MTSSKIGSCSTAPTCRLIVDVSEGTSTKKEIPMAVTPTSKSLLTYVCTCPFTTKVQVVSSVPPKKPSSMAETSILVIVTWYLVQRGGGGGVPPSPPPPGVGGGQQQQQSLMVGTSSF